MRSYLVHSRSLNMHGENIKQAGRGDADARGVWKTRLRTLTLSTVVERLCIVSLNLYETPKLLQTIFPLIDSIALKTEQCVLQKLSFNQPTSHDAT